ncbi:MAG: CapA family protein [Bacteroidales bacterium]|nr:CapA family protein [Bacteroidales bacterium]
MKTEKKPWYSGLSIFTGKIARNHLLPWSVAVVLAVFLLSKPSYLLNGQPQPTPPSNPEISLIFMGDIMQHMPQVESAWNDSLGKYIYDSCFQYVRPLIESYDLAIANLETTLAGKPYSGYPAFSSPDDLVNGLISAGIDILGTANNHCCDRGGKGVKRTSWMLDSLGIMHMGTYATETEWKERTPLIVEQKGFKLAFLNYTYGTNGIPVPEGTVVNLIDKNKISEDLKKAKSMNPDAVFIFIHWGEEYQREPNAYQKDIAEFCFLNGADYIIGSHPHVIQKMEWQKPDSLHSQRLVAWSLGNYVSNQRKRYTDGGAMFDITLVKENGRTRIKDAGYHLTWVYNPIRYGKRQYYILPVKQFESDSGFMSAMDFADMQLYISDSRELFRNNLNITER